MTEPVAIWATPDKNPPPALACGAATGAGAGATGAGACCLAAGVDDVLPRLLLPLLLRAIYLEFYLVWMRCGKKSLETWIAIFAIYYTLTLRISISALHLIHLGLHVGQDFAIICHFNWCLFLLVQSFSICLLLQQKGCSLGMSKFNLTQSGYG